MSIQYAYMCFYFWVVFIKSFDVYAQCALHMLLSFVHFFICFRFWSLVRFLYFFDLFFYTFSGTVCFGCAPFQFVSMGYFSAIPMSAVLKYTYAIHTQFLFSWSFFTSLSIIILTHFIRKHIYKSFVRLLSV